MLALPSRADPNNHIAFQPLLGYNGHMNWHYVVIIIAVFIMFISMGSNPFEPPEGWVPPDEFKDGIRARINQQPGSLGGQPFGMGGGGANMGNMGGGNFGGTGFNGANTGLASPNLGTNYGIGTDGNISGYRPNMSMNAPAGIAQPNRNFRQLQNAPAPNRNVPAPFQNMPGTIEPQSDASDYVFPGVPNFRTNSGKPVRFAGSTVLTFNKDGRKIVMPDGKYALDDGRVITVRAGKNMFPVGGNEFN